MSDQRGKGPNHQSNGTKLSLAGIISFVLKIQSPQLRLTGAVML